MTQSSMNHATEVSHPCFLYHRFLRPNAPAATTTEPTHLLIHSPTPPHPEKKNCCPQELFQTAAPGYDITLTKLSEASSEWQLREMVTDFLVKGGPNAPHQAAAGEEEANKGASGRAKPKPKPAILVVQADPAPHR